MQSNIVGFVGAKKDDILLYLAKILSRLGKKVLLVDYTENRALTYCIKVPYHEQSFFHLSEQEVDFMIEPQYEYLFQVQNSYDVILVDFGFQVYSKLIAQCKILYCCVDTQLRHMLLIRPLKQFMEQRQEQCFLIFRKIKGCNVDASYLINEVDIQLMSHHIYEYCEDDLYKNSFHVMTISRELKSCLLFLIRTIQIDISNPYQNKRFLVCNKESWDGNKTDSLLGNGVL